MSMYNDIDCDQKHNEDVCKQNSACVAKYPERRWTFLGPREEEEKWHGSLPNKVDGKWNTTAEDTMKKVCRERTPSVQVFKPIIQQVLRSEGGGTSSTRCCGGFDIFRFLTCLDYERSQWMKKQKTGVMNRKTSHSVTTSFMTWCRHLHRTYEQMCIFLGKIGRSTELNMLKMPHSIQRNPSSQNTQSGETKNASVV